MRPIADLPVPEAARLRGLLFDLDDTLLSHGSLSESAYSALFRLRESGLLLVAVTGRPAGWGAVLARQWPVAAVVAENGAIALRRDGGRVIRIDPVAGGERAKRCERLRAIAAELTKRFDSLTPADDVDARVTDYAFDIGEHRVVDDTTVTRIAAAARALGAQVTHSSVHLHISLDGDDKASGAIRVLGEIAGTDATVARARFAYIGDSENDASCFAAFETTIAVANFRGRPTVPPRYRTDAAMGEGFAEAARVLTARRR